MGGPVIEAVEHRARFERDMAEGIILAHEPPDRVKIVEPHQSLELDLAAEVASHQVDMAEAWNVARLDAGNHFRSDDPFIVIGILRRSPAAPEPADHHTR